jgi:hypothetical protein
MVAHGRALAAAAGASLHVIAAAEGTSLVV